MSFDTSSNFVPSSKIDHVGISAPGDQFESLVEWYKKALAPLNYKELMRFPGAVGLGDEVPDFWIMQTESDTPQNVHFAFAATDYKTVDAFYDVAIAAGGKCNGKPGLRTEYHPKYYGAFIVDPRGNNVEMVCHYGCPGKE
ncbi:Glyoxalase/Bleomycin resistance protein/Dihydroxybiphenyl dioxygenase [Aspergillus steynii IBT 23096]|uniref:Glyoxalase/Bleomycin resistance protein/Dihydroxybiphenyl dioxygenase n=1 Tax=Aspergillus steynii IBT 23096 TaxID=1392250 RepID=A0A2I2G6D0_9EURO|nr:Glyoxalase/Bleomycin resistance protein/Dihydroxybiphenyl dioxygenase [Aspergillus steynii IBT 23096]PLB48422.1 Glyoxalase/Bleomycin resistance protein/Dihydroxybiphenyl dioxygenase [Aspergillus steynii IBT 23096]